MGERRKNKRYAATLNLEISSLFKQDNVKVENIDAPIEVCDISRSGIGFISKSELPLGFYFNACLVLGEDNAKLYCVVKIIRKKTNEDASTHYGCEFIGLAPVLSYIFDDFEKKSTELD